MCSVIKRVSVPTLILICVSMLSGMAIAAETRQDSAVRLTPASLPADSSEDRAWYNGQDLRIEGKGWEDTESYYDRLPVRARASVTTSVWGLSRNSAGMAVRFMTDASHVTVRWTLTSSNLAMPHMPATGVSGLDLYVRYEGRWRWLGIGRPGNGITHEATIGASIGSPGIHEFMLYLPLYNGVKSLEIAVPRKAQLLRPAARIEKPICVYGTSIVQGGCASRPGMAHVAILGRRLDRPTINLGFSGSGKMEPALATLLGELDVAAYVLDCLPNMTNEMVTERVGPFVESLRKLRPETPIVLVESVIPQNTVFLPPSERSISKKNKALRDVYEKFQSKQTINLHYVSGELLLGDDGESTVDGIHPNDLGFWRMAEALAPPIGKIIRARQ